MDYTSNLLDAGFAKYRNNMVDWSKYEEVERKAITMNQQLEKTIREEDIMLGELRKMEKSSRIIVGKQV